jgi:NAD(P)-dependent dehydrogenase (short-subunit alcohol dehydrogenase family)
MAEITGTDPRVEVGYRDGGRFVPRLVETPAGTDGAVVRPGDTLLVTGGAQGITFEMLQALTRTTPVNLVILGRSDLEELARIPGGATAAPPALMEELKARLPGAKPVAIRQALERLLRIRDTRAHLAALEAAGIRVDYHPADVTDAAAVAAVVARYPRIDGVIHAAGLEESRLIPGKTAASFDRVFDTKVFGALHLMEALEARAVRFFLAFSSVTARFGNECQADYTAANDMLGKLLLAWRAAAPGRIVRVLAWTAWEGAGMATRETVRKVLQERGLQFLPLADGVARFLAELRDESATEVVISGYDRAFDPDGLLPRAPEAATGGGLAPFLDQRLEADAGRAVFARVLDPARDLFLHDHAREGVPIFLGATGIEAMAEAAASLAAPGATLRELRDFSIPYGIKILKGRPKELQIDAVRTGTAGDTFLCRITSQFRNPKGVAMGSPTLHYRGTYVFDRQTPAAPAIALPDFQPPGYAGDIQALLYHPKRLFMDGLFRTVEDILSFDGQMLVSRIRAAGDGAFFADGRPTDFTTDIRVVDAMFQTGGMLEVMSSNIIVLPYAIGRMVFHRPLPPGQAFLCLTERTRAGRETNTYQLRLTDAGGGLYLTIEDFEMVQLEQLAPEHQILDRLNLERRAS